MTAADDALALLDDYLSAAMSDVHASDFEERLFAEAAAGRAPELGYLDTLFDQAQWFVMRGGFSSGATAEQIAELRKLPHVHYIDVEADTRVGAWPADTKYVVYRLDVDLRGYENIDVAIVTPDGEHRKWFRDVVYDPKDGALYGACDAPLAASTFRHEPLIARIQASRAGSGLNRETVAELSVTPK
ncbi:MAG TPA: hypothetical protein VER11_28235 [Polyangiaceae bacterium]|nr:hypothetical protein [Polyangiaceae bacterium]